MDFFDLCLKRESCRAYTGGTVPREIIEKILEAGRLAPSACNSQPWKFYAVINKDACKAVQQGVRGLVSNKFTDKASAFIVILGAKESYTEKVSESICGRDFSNIDIGITVANMALAATSLGYGTCILGAFNEDKVREGAGIDKNIKEKVKLVLAVGVPEQAEPRVKKRKSTADVVVFVE